MVRQWLCGALLAVVGVAAADVRDNMPTTTHNLPTASLSPATTYSLFDESLSVTLVGVPEAQAQLLAERIEHWLPPWRVFLDQQRTSELVRQAALPGASAESNQRWVELLALCETGWQTTQGAFSCRTGELLQQWQRAADADALPDRAAMRHQAQALQAMAWPVAPESVAAHDLWIDPNGLAEALLLDTLLRSLLQWQPGLSGIALRLGDIHRFWGRDSSGEPWRQTVACAPLADWHCGAPLVTDGAVASNAQAWAFRLIDRRRVSPWIDPRDGWALTQMPWVTVAATDSASARMLAVALSVLPIAEGMALVASLPGVEALLVTDTGTSFVSAGWYALQAADSYPSPPWPTDWTFRVDYQIPEHPVVEYRRPYAALWITDAQRQLVRQLRVHGDNRRWLTEVPTWWRRIGRRHESALDGLARPTPRPGWQTVLWDGRDDLGRGVPAGLYILHVEVSREHGGRERVSVDFELRGKPLKVAAQGVNELGQLRVHLTRD